ncbi:uncharacterized protein F5891DRAFT_1010883 [Suillus fuscotomentosus]|uniref:Uncharacterized protein n=1 Tax=Suillus fuscotomentosus TaxID=1912939 RepID=A0AAD4EFI3_9AGAM|nr:uncharacterized protein F5891DRAFT_1010883 [Suillus fuscotomentosus]KAG1905102.1 hypothetical protein F5891DRAFT_1010883 [Suillus fuscotomentosus]
MIVVDGFQGSLGFGSLSVRSYIDSLCIVLLSPNQVIIPLTWLPSFSVLPSIKSRKYLIGPAAIVMYLHQKPHDCAVQSHGIGNKNSSWRLSSCTADLIEEMSSSRQRPRLIPMSSYIRHPQANVGPQRSQPHHYTWHTSRCTRSLAPEHLGAPCLAWQAGPS